MKALLFPEYGVMELQDIEKPVPNDEQILVRMVAAAVNPLDWHRMRADPFLVRLGDGFFKPKNPKLGADIAGIVEAVGKNISQFKPGDEVYGDISSGGFAEYALAGEKHLVLKPANISFEEAAAVPVATLTAIQGLRDAGDIQPGQKVLINGASGGIGTFAVQIARAYGAEVTGVCSGRNAEMVRSIGASHVIDYTKEDFTRTGQQYDLIYDAIGNRSVFDYERALKPNGKCVIAGFTTFARMLEHVLIGKMRSRNGKSIGMMGTAQMRQSDLMTMNELLESKKVIPVIDRCYPLSQAADAIRYVETSRARGKVIVNINPA